MVWYGVGMTKRIAITDLKPGMTLSLDGGMNYFVLHSIDSDAGTADWGVMDDWKISGKFASLRD